MSRPKYIVSEHRPEPTERELQVLRLVAEGLQNKEIAQRLHISPKTVEFHKTRLYERSGVTGAVMAIRVAIRKGWLPTDVLDLPPDNETEDDHIFIAGVH